MNVDAIRIFDTTLRDGEQTPGIRFTVEQKIEIARALEAAGVHTIEAGFPASSPGDHDAVRAVAAAVRDAEVAALSRCIQGDIAAAGDALREATRPVMHVFIATSDRHIERKLRTTRAAVVRAIAESIRHARGYADAVEFSAEDATRADGIFLRQCVATAIEAGATRINLPDTVGFATPDEYAARIGDIIAFIADPAILVSAHCHNDLGMATANSIAAIGAGARQVEVTVNGIGERAGNAALEQVAVAVTAKGIARTMVDTTRLAAISGMVSGATGIPIPVNQPITGANAFAHASGIHQDGVIKDPGMYECFSPGVVGGDGHRIVLTARSGRKALQHVAAQHGVPIPDGQTEAVYSAFLHHADRTPGEVSAQHVVALVRSTVRPS